MSKGPCKAWGGKGRANQRDFHMKKAAASIQCFLCKRKRGFVVNAGAMLGLLGVPQSFAHPRCLEKKLAEMAGTTPKHRSRK